MAISSMPMTLGAGQPARRSCSAHVLLVQLLDGLPIEVQLLGDGLDGTIPATPADIEGEPLGVERVVGQPVETFGLHAATPPTIDPANREVEVDAPVATGEVAHAARSLVVDVGAAPHTPQAFFRRRRSGMTTAYGSPKMPWTPARGTKPGNR